MKINKRDVVQVVKDKETGTIKRIVHKFTPKNYKNSSAWMQKFFKGFNRKLRNGFVVPTGQALKDEIALIQAKKSKLSRRERDTVLRTGGL